MFSLRCVSVSYYLNFSRDFQRTYITSFLIIFQSFQGCEIANLVLSKTYTQSAIHGPEGTQCGEVLLCFWCLSTEQKEEAAGPSEGRWEGPRRWSRECPVSWNVLHLGQAGTCPSCCSSPAWWSYLSLLRYWSYISYYFWYRHKNPRQSLFTLSMTSL